MNMQEHEKKIAAKKRSAARAAANKILARYRGKVDYDHRAMFDEVKRAEAAAEKAAEQEYIRSNPDYAKRSLETWKAGIAAKLGGKKK